MIIIAVLACSIVPATANAAPVNLATVQPFVVLAGSAVTNTGPSVLNGSLGVSPGTSLTGFGLPAVVNGATYDNDAVALQAQADLTVAYNTAAGQPVSPSNDLTGTDLGNRSLDPGAYRFSSSAQLTGALRLNAHGDPDAQFVFQVGSTLTTASASSIVLVNGASPCNVYWQIGSSATLGTTTKFAGNLMALTSISLNNGATVQGRMLARNGAVTLINDVLTNIPCLTTPGGTVITPPVVTPGDTPPGSTPGGSVPGTVPPGAPASTVTLAKTVSDNRVHAGQLVHYTLRVKNVSDISATGVVTCDKIPVHMQFVKADRKGVLRFGSICFKLGTIKAGAIKRVHIVLRVLRDTRPGKITNTSTANATNSNATVTARVPITVTKTPPKRTPPSVVSG